MVPQHGVALAPNKQPHIHQLVPRGRRTLKRSPGMCTTLQRWQDAGPIRSGSHGRMVQVGRPDASTPRIGSRSTSHPITELK
jgi:hypothetical protein